MLNYQGEEEVTFTGQDKAASQDRNKATTPNEYPLSKSQIKKGKTVKEMHQRLLFDIQSHIINPADPKTTIYGSKWQTEKKEVFLTKLAESKEAVGCNERAKKRRKIIYEGITYSSNANNGIICKMLEQAKMSRGQLLYEAVEQAANIKSFGFNSFVILKGLNQN